MISAIVRKSNWWVRGPLLAVMVFTLPVFFYFFVIGGLVPYVWLLVATLPALLLPFNIFALVYTAHLAVYGFPMYWISGLLSRWICLCVGWKRFAVLAVVCALLLAIGARPIFGIGHEEMGGLNAYEILVDPSSKPIP